MAEERKKRIHNPVTGKYYKVRQKSSKHGKPGQIKGLWRPLIKIKGDCGMDMEITQHYKFKNQITITRRALIKWINLKNNEYLIERIVFKESRTNEPSQEYDFGKSDSFEVRGRGHAENKRFLEVGRMVCQWPGCVVATLDYKNHLKEKL